MFQMTDCYVNCGAQGRNALTEQDQCFSPRWDTENCREMLMFSARVSHLTLADGGLLGSSGVGNVHRRLKVTVLGGGKRTAVEHSLGAGRLL
jgi:hypothetical protein